MKNQLHNGILAFAAATLISGALSCNAGYWGINDGTNGVCQSGEGSGYVFPVYSYDTGGIVEPGTTTVMDGSGLSVTGRVSAWISLLSNSGAEVDVQYEEFAHAGAWGDYTWIGAAGYPYGPEFFPIHIAVGVNGGCGISGGVGLHCSTTAFAKYCGGAIMSGDTIGGTIDCSCSGEVLGSVAGDNMGVADYSVGGSWSNLDDFNEDYNSFNAGVSSGFSLEEDYILEVQTPPSVQLVTWLTAITDASITSPGYAAENVGAMTDTTIVGSASLTFGTPY